MEYSKVVSVSGYLLASLLYEQANNEYDQEGFLIGDITMRELEIISDKQISLKREEMTINVHSYVPCDMVCSFYADDGQVTSEVIGQYIGGQMKQLVGWYRFRNYLPLHMSVREIAVHKNMNRSLPHCNNMVFGLFCQYRAKNSATHAFDHRFFFYNDAQFIVAEHLFEPISLNVINLGDTSHEEYRVCPWAPVNTRHGAYGSVVSPNKDHDDILKSALPIEEVYTDILAKVEELVQYVADSEEELKFKLLEIQDLEQKISELQVDE